MHTSNVTNLFLNEYPSCSTFLSTYSAKITECSKNRTFRSFSCCTPADTKSFTWNVPCEISLPWAFIRPWKIKRHVNLLRPSGQKKISFLLVCFVSVGPQGSHIVNVYPIDLVNYITKWGKIGLLGAKFANVLVFY